MDVLEFGDPANKKIVIFQGFLCPCVILEDYINYYKKDFHIIVPVLPGHNPDSKEEFTSIEKTVKEFEDFYIKRYGNEIYAACGMSMGGVFAGEIWKNKNISIEKIIFESTPLLSFRKHVASLITRYYLRIKCRMEQGNKKALNLVTDRIVKAQYIPDFQKLLHNISEDSISNYISEISQFKLPADIESNTKVYYFYGGTLSESFFSHNARFLKRNYKNVEIFKQKGKGHCEDSILNSSQWIFTLNQIL